MQDWLNKYSNLSGSIDKLHPYQLKAISNIINGKNTLAIAPTGSGKSLIYQIAAQELPGSTIIISPLVALINEQVSFLESKHISVLKLTGEIPFAKQRELLRQLALNKPKFIFLSPERLHNAFFRAALKRSGLTFSLLVIDEAHCISQWGIDFRPEYGEINNFRVFLKEVGQNPTVLALTATLGSEARKDITADFNIDESYVLVEKSVIREELDLNFIQITEETEKTGKALSLLREHKPKKAIVYFYSIDKCNKFCQKLTEEKIIAEAFHADRKKEDKNAIYEKFRVGEINVLCATTAFGMGLNIPDIDFVLHYQIPNSIEEYYQQVGRAARDRRICNSALCFLLWSDKNFEHKLTDQIPKSLLTIQKINNAFKALGLENKADLPVAIEYSNYVKQELSFYKFLFEKRNILRTIGELNGTPKTIKFKKANSYWQELLKNMGFGNNYVRMATNSNMTVQELIDYVFEQELSGLIEKFPALEKKIFFSSSFNTIPLNEAYQIIENSINVGEFRKNQILDLKKLVESDNPHSFINTYLS